MVSIEKIEQGVANYLDKELMPQLNNNDWERVVVGTAVSLAIRKSGTIVAGYKDHKVVKMLGIMDEKGDVDLETLVPELKKNIPQSGFKVDVPVIGTLTFHKEDVDKLYEFIKEA